MSSATPTDAPPDAGWTEPQVLRVSHLTRFHYHSPAYDSYNEARLHPLSDFTQSCVKFDLEITPKGVVREYPDIYDNIVHYFDILQAHEDLTVLAFSEVHTHADHRPTVPETITMDTLLQPWKETTASESHSGFLHGSEYVSLGDEILNEAHKVNPGDIQDLWMDAVAIGRYIYSNFQYTPLSTSVNTRPEEVVHQRKGVCQDFAHLMLGMCRSRGIPARYVSGYFYNPDKKPGEAEASHAWVEVFLPHYGWKGFDPTHNRVPDTRYVKLAIGRDYGDIRPLSGTFRGKGTREMIVEVHIDHVQSATS